VAILVRGPAGWPLSAGRPGHLHRPGVLDRLAVRSASTEPQDAAPQLDGTYGRSATGGCFASASQGARLREGCIERRSQLFVAARGGRHRHDGSVRAPATPGWNGAPRQDHQPGLQTHGRKAGTRRSDASRSLDRGLARRARRSATRGVRGCSAAGPLANDVGEVRDHDCGMLPKRGASGTKDRHRRLRLRCSRYGPRCY